MREMNESRAEERLEERWAKTDDGTGVAEGVDSWRSAEHGHHQYVLARVQRTTQICIPCNEGKSEPTDIEPVQMAIFLET